MYSPNKFHNHIKKFHAGGKFLTCRICDNNYAKTGEDQPHMKEVTPKPFKCTYLNCHRSFLAASSLENHIKIVHFTDTSVLCDTCGICLKNKAVLRTHMKWMHPVEQPSSVMCDICGKSFTRSIYLRSHKRAHHSALGQIMEQCKICNKFYKKLFMPKHMANHKIEAIKIKCQYCDKMFSTKTLRYHELRHMGIRRKKCSICFQYSNSEASLQKHLKKHKEGDIVILSPRVTPSQCEICSKILLHRINMESHMSTHFGIKPFKCNFCDQKFVNERFLKRHIAQKHDTEYLKKLVCQYCNKQLQSKLSLLGHESVHRKEKTFLCSFCDKKYYFYGTLRKHVTANHK
jgi:uncharacterized Zn-finger protein